MTQMEVANGYKSYSKPAIFPFYAYFVPVWNYPGEYFFHNNIITVAIKRHRRLCQNINVNHENGSCFTPPSVPRVVLTNYSRMNMLCVIWFKLIFRPIFNQ